MDKLTPCLWFDNNAETAVNFYISVFANSRIISIMRWPPGGPAPEGTVLVIYFELEGQSFMAMNGGPHFKFTEAISLSIACETQAEVDVLWTKLTADGGQDSECSWVKDKFGLSWQIAPKVLAELLQDPDRQKAGRVMAAMMTMKKINIDKIKEAAQGA